MKAKTISIKRCSKCGQRLPGGNPYAPRPMQLDSRFKRCVTSITRVLKLIEDQRGRSAARAAKSKLTKALSSIE